MADHLRASQSANQRARKALFTCVVYTNYEYRQILHSQTEVTVTVAFILWFSVNFQTLRRRWAMQRLPKRRHLRFLQYKIFRLRQTHLITLITVVVNYCGKIDWFLSPLIAVAFPHWPIFQLDIWPYHNPNFGSFGHSPALRIHPTF